MTSRFLRRGESVAIESWRTAPSGNGGLPRPLDVWAEGWRAGRPTHCIMSYYPGRVLHGTPIRLWAAVPSSRGPNPLPHGAYLTYHCSRKLCLCELFQLCTFPTKRKYAHNWQKQKYTNLSARTKNCAK